MTKVKKTESSSKMKDTPLMGTATDLAGWLGIAIKNAQQMKSAGRITPDDNGLYDLKAEVSKYCRELRAKKKGSSSSGGIAEEKTFWQVENLKAKNREWRMQYGRDVGLAVLSQMRAALDRLKAACKLVPNIADVIREVAESIPRVDIDAAVTMVEGSEEDED